ncbi:K02A2.6-like [Cordylochernes scorpioides]|uniref:K02A2.6-like n=1 Tax=Cordylochernes scorpioides TaxID=51811 RepID=A0ABY6LPJ6_9ARAC|nr:K02A2.6-like [Cordylochernes scorpioides]
MAINYKFESYDNNEDFKSTLNPWEYPNKTWQRMHADFIGPFQNHMLLALIDAHRKWPERYFSLCGILEKLVTDNGSQFTAAEFSAFTKSFAIKYVLTPPGHPATKGAAEKFVGTFRKH